MGKWTPPSILHSSELIAFLLKAVDRRMAIDAIGYAALNSSCRDPLSDTLTTFVALIVPELKIVEGRT